MIYEVLYHCPSLLLTIPVAKKNGEIAMALGDHKNAFRRQAGVKVQRISSQESLWECGAKAQERGEQLASEGIYERGEAEEQKSLQLVLWNLAATSVSFPIPRLILIA